MYDKQNNIKSTLTDSMAEAAFSSKDLNDSECLIWPNLLVTPAVNPPINEVVFW